MASWIAIIALGSAAIAPRATAAESGGTTPVDLAAWARHEGKSRLLAQLETAGTPGAHDLISLIPDAAEDPGPRGSLTQEPVFWAFAVESREATQLALAAHVLDLAESGDMDRLNRHAPLIEQASRLSTAAAPILRDLASRLPGDDAATPPLDVGDLALDSGDSALAAFAYRLVLLNDRPEDYAYRDIAGHYFYCLDRLGAAPDVQKARAHFNATVVFPSVLAQSRARQTLASEPPAALTAAE